MHTSTNYMIVALFVLSLRCLHCTLDLTPPRLSVIRTPYSIYWSRNLKLYQVQSADDRLDKGLRFHVSKS